MLATYGVDSKGKLYVHIKVWKARRIFGEIVVVGGSVKLRCRDCLRWQRVNIIQEEVTLIETSVEPSIHAI